MSKEKKRIREDVSNTTRKDHWREKREEDDTNGKQTRLSFSLLSRDRRKSRRRLEKTTRGLQ